MCLECSRVWCCNLYMNTPVHSNPLELNENKPRINKRVGAMQSFVPVLPKLISEDTTGLMQAGFHLSFLSSFKRKVPVRVEQIQGLYNLGR